jgi:M6 family metalloprotease-like protein
MRAMVDSAEAAGIDWTEFDNDGDGDVDCVTLVHAGQGAEQGNGSNIWSHRWSLGSNQVTYDGVLINDYNVNPEIQGTGIVAIGVIAHEFGHALGLPDLYDTDYTSSGSGKLALMASGSWGTTGSTPWYPSAMNAWCKTEMGWSNVITISSAQTNVELEQSYTNNTIYRVDNPEDNSEYWLIENRQKKGTDVLMQEPGMLFWHIDTEKTSGGGVNNDEPHYGVGLEQADGLFELENDGASDRGDPYPGLTDNHEFTHCTTPSTVSYYYEPSMVAFTNISYADSIMTFEVSFDDIATGTMSAIGFGDAYAVGYLSISMANSVTLNELSFELSQHPNILSLENIDVTGRASADSIIVTNDFIELVNPVIPAGSGEILMLTVFANTGSDGTVNVSAEDVTANDANGNIVCFTFDESTYLVNPIVQGIVVDSATAFSGETAPVYIDLHNSIPIRMIIATINTSHPNRLYPVAETYVDANNNGTYDQGENFFDINNDGIWTPTVQPTERTANWDFSYQINDTGIIVAGLHSIDTIAIGTGPIFQINYMVDSNAPAGNVSLILANVNLTDMFGNYNLQYNGTNGVFVITTLQTENELSLPEKFSMSANYPNPFNPVTHVDFTIPEATDVSFAIYSLLGQQVTSQTNTYQPGTYKLTWNGRDQLGNELSSGVYLLKMESGSFLQTRKLVLMK